MNGYHKNSQFDLHLIFFKKTSIYSFFIQFKILLFYQKNSEKNKNNKDNFLSLNGKVLYYGKKIIN